MRLTMNLGCPCSLPRFIGHKKRVFFSAKRLARMQISMKVQAVKVQCILLIPLLLLRRRRRHTPTIQMQIQKYRLNDVADGMTRSCWLETGRPNGLEHVRWGRDKNLQCYNWNDETIHDREKVGLQPRKVYQFSRETRSLERFFFNSHMISSRSFHIFRIQGYIVTEVYYFHY